MRLSKARREFVTAMMKDTIFEAAGSVLEQHGVGGITMDRVATKAGLATGSLYNYFQDKDDLLHFFYSRLVEPCIHAIEEAADEDLPAPQKMERILRTSLEYAVKHKGLLRLLAGMDYDSEVKKKTRPRLLQILTTIFEQGIKEGSFRPHEPTHTGRMFLGCLSELFELQAGGAADEEGNRFAETLIDATVNGFSIHARKSPEPGGANPSPLNP
jgi:AcrR family transcriptional regulator